MVTSVKLITLYAKDTLQLSSRTSPVEVAMSCQVSDDSFMMSEDGLTDLLVLCKREVWCSPGLFYQHLHTRVEFYSTHTFRNLKSIPSDRTSKDLICGFAKHFDFFLSHPPPPFFFLVTRLVPFFWLRFAGGFQVQG